MCFYCRLRERQVSSVSAHMLLKTLITERKALESLSFYCGDHTYHLEVLMERKEGAERFSLYSFQNTPMRMQCSEHLSLTALYIMNPLNVNG